MWLQIYKARVQSKVKRVDGWLENSSLGDWEPHLQQMINISIPGSTFICMVLPSSQIRGEKN